MISRLLTVSCAGLLASIASAQCFETNYGTQIGLGDDTLLPAQALGFNFPMGATNYTHIIPNTNGVAFLHTAATGALGTTATGYSTNSATMVTNLRGAAGGAPRLAAYWRDLNFTAANTGAVWANATNPNKFVLTWRNGVHFGQTSPLLTFQMQVFADGHVEYFYGLGVTNTALGVTVGVSQGGGIADPGISDLSVASTGVSTSRIVYQTFGTLGAFDLATTNVSFTPNVGGGYDVNPTPCVPANSTSYGAGCYKNSATFYESIAPNTIDLSNSAIRMTPTATGYAVSSGSTAFYTHTVAGLALGDDANGTLALPTPFTYPSGSTSTLTICSNGYIWLQPNTTADFSPTVAEIYSGAARLMPLWCDGVPDGAANVNNVFAEVDAVNNKAYVSWLNIPIFGGVGGTMNVQCEIDLTTNVVEYRYGAVSCGNVSIVGWTPGTGVSTIDFGSRDLSTVVPAGFTVGTPEFRAISQTATAPVAGSTMTFTVNDIPEAVVGSGVYIGLHILSVGQTNPGLDLASLGAPGCSTYVTSLDVTQALVGAANSQTYSFAVPAGVTGVSLYSQAAALVAPGTLNAFGLVTSNGLKHTINTF